MHESDMVAFDVSHKSPSLPWRVGSSLIMGITGALSRGFLYGLNSVEVTGLDQFLELLEKRKNIEGRNRGLITVSNHVSVVDDPLIWGVLPLRYAFNPSNLRWSLGSYDICFQNKALSLFFSLGQVLPTHRGAYSPIHGGLFQPTMTQAIRLLSSKHLNLESRMSSVMLEKTSSDLTDVSDPFSTNALTYSTNGEDIFPAPSAYTIRRHSWVHIFPEGRVHQHPNKTLRYFKWGISRLILESEPLPEIVPIFIDGNQEVMHESRGWPRPMPRTGKDLKIAFGEKLDGDKIFGDLRARWKTLVQMQKNALVKSGCRSELEMGELTEGLMHGREAVSIRKEVTDRVRMEVLKVRRRLGYPDEDHKQGLVETWIEEGPKRSGRMNDGSFVGET